MRNWLTRKLSAVPKFNTFRVRFRRVFTRYEALRVMRFSSLYFHWDDTPLQKHRVISVQSETTQRSYCCKIAITLIDPSGVVLSVIACGC